MGYEPSNADRAEIICRAARSIQCGAWEISADESRQVAETGVDAIVNRDRGCTIRAAAWRALLASGIHENPVEQYAGAVVAAWYWHLDPDR